MNNYWLSEFDHQDNDEPDMEMPEDPHDEEEDDEEEEEEENDPKSRLNKRQLMMYDHYEEVVEEFGMFDQSSKANGAHYAPASDNPFKEKGLICGNCVYFHGGQQCEIVKGRIESDAICKLWIIPEDLIKE